VVWIALGAMGCTGGGVQADMVCEWVQYLNRTSVSAEDEAVVCQSGPRRYFIEEDGTFMFEEHFGYTPTGEECPESTFYEVLWELQGEWALFELNAHGQNRVVFWIDSEHVVTRGLEEDIDRTSELATQFDDLVGTWRQEITDVPDVVGPPEVCWRYTDTLELGPNGVFTQNIDFVGSDLPQCVRVVAIADHAQGGRALYLSPGGGYLEVP